MLSNFLTTCVDVSHLQIIPQQFTHRPERRKLSPVSVAVQLAKDMMSESACSWDAKRHINVRFSNN